MKKIKQIDYFKGVAYVLNIFFTILILFPLAFMISNSVKDDIAIYDMPPSFIPKSPNSVEIVVDYSDDVKEESEKLKGRVIKDCALAMFSTLYEFDRSSIGEIKYYGIMNGKTIFYSRSHRAHLKLEADYGIYKGIQVNKNTISLNNKHIDEMDKIGYLFNTDGIDKNYNSFENSDFSKQMEEKFNDNYDLDGQFKGVAVKKSPLLMFENFKYYLQSPSYVFNSDAFIKKFSFFAFFYNTIFGIVVVLIIQVGLCGITAYGLSKLFDKRTSDLLLLFFLATLMIPYISIFIPTLKLIQTLGIDKGYLAMFFPHLCPSAFFIFIYKGFFDQLPSSLFDAARIDGAGEWYTFLRICLPLSKPIMGVIALNAFFNEWGNFFWYFIVANDTPRYWTINLAIYELSINPTTKQNLLMGISVVMAIPILLLTIFLSDKIKESIAMAGIKG